MSDLHALAVQRARELIALERSVEACAAQLSIVWSGPEARVEAEPDLSLESDAIACAAEHIAQIARSLSASALRAAELAEAFRQLAHAAEHEAPPARPTPKKGRARAR